MIFPEIPPKEIDTETLRAALLDVAYEVVEVAKRTGTPVIVWEDGAVRELDPWTIVLPERTRPKPGKKPSIPSSPPQKAEEEGTVDGS